MNCNYKVKIKDIQNKYQFKIFCAPRGEKGEKGEKGDTGATGPIGTPLVASSVSEMTDTTRNYINTTDGHWYYYNGSTWVDGGAYQSSQLGSDTINELYEIMDNYLVKTIHGNLFNANTCTDGKYLAGSDGHETTGSAYSYSDYIPTYGKDLIFSGYTLTNQVYCYDENKSVVGHAVANTYNSDGLPNGTSYVRFNFGTATKSNVRVHFNVEDKKIDLGYGVKKIKQEDIYGGAFITPINVYVGSTRTITSLVDAVETYKNQATKQTPVNIYLDAGTYDVLTTEMLENGNSSFEGLTLPDYMNIYGSGMYQTFITATVPVDISSYSVDRNKISTINAWKNNNIKDVTISMTNGRYAFHNDDWRGRAVANAYEEFENVRFIYNPLSSGVPSTSVTSVPVGIGAYNGRVTKFKNCIFDASYSECRRPLLIHNNTSSPLPCSWEFDNCDFLGGYNGTGISTAGSGQDDLVILKGCYFTNNINFYPQSVYIGTTSEFILRGYSNTIPGYTWTNLTEDNTKIRMI